MRKELVKQITSLLKKAGVKGDIELTTPPNHTMGDVAFGCFALAKLLRKSPAEAANEIVKKLETRAQKTAVDKVLAVGPYVNFYLNPGALAELVLKDVQSAKFGQSNLGKGKKIMVEFAHPNTHKAFHIGHLRNIVTGEALVRILENAGYEVIRANYQGDVGPQVARCLWSVQNKLAKEFKKVQAESLAERAKFLGQAYAIGNKAYEESDQAKVAILELNKKIYNRDKSIKEIYDITRQWSLDYFNSIYKRVYTHFDKLYFESEVFERGQEIVREYLLKGVFTQSEGAIIFAGSKYGLHDRVFITKAGNATYEAKDLGLAERQLKEKKVNKIFHVTGKEQIEYFKVVFKALEQVLKSSVGKEQHLPYGWVRLKSGKMSSRTGEVVLGEELLDDVKGQVLTIMKDSDVQEKEDVAETVAVAAVKYGFLKTGIKNDIAFDIKESTSIEGDSGPYLLYIVARIKSILNKAGKVTGNVYAPNELAPAEKALLMHLGDFAGVAERAAKLLDPSLLARYLYDLAKKFNSFYQACPVLQSEGEVKVFRLQLVQIVLRLVEKGLDLLGIKSVDKM